MRLLPTDSPTKTSIISLRRGAVEGLEGAELRLRCQSSHSMPPANITWFIVRQEGADDADDDEDDEEEEEEEENERWRRVSSRREEHRSHYSSSFTEVSLPNSLQNNSSSNGAYTTNSIVTFILSSRDHRAKVVCRASNQVTGSSVQDSVALDVTCESSSMSLLCFNFFILY